MGKVLFTPEQLLKDFIRSTRKVITIKNTIMTQTDIRVTVNNAAETMLLLIEKFNKEGATGINTLAISMKAITHILADQLKEYNEENNVQVWVMRSADTGEIWGKFNDLTEAISTKERYERMDIIDGIYREDMYLISQEPINAK